ncbi:MAG: hypothetical protein WCG85_13585 [Polyangia bacterium]
MRTLDPRLGFVRTLVSMALAAATAVAVPRLAWAQAAPTIGQTSSPREPADGWQRGLEIGGVVADFVNLGCGLEMLRRQERKEWGSGEYNKNRDWHIGLAATAGGINLLAAWQQWEINRQRTSFEFRHIAHNALFWTNIAALVASAALGIASAEARGNGHLDAAHALGVAMEATGFLSLGSAIADVIFFGGHDNATIVGPRLAF